MLLSRSPALKDPWIGEIEDQKLTELMSRVKSGAGGSLSEMTMRVELGKEQPESIPPLPSKPDEPIYHLLNVAYLISLENLNLEPPWSRFLFNHEA